MKSKTEIIEHLKLLIEQTTFARVSAQSIKPSDRLIADLGLDSLDYAGTMLACERWSNIKIKENKVSWGEVDTVEKLADLFVAHASL